MQIFFKPCLVTLCLVFFSFCPIKAQTKATDIIYLKDGSEIKGKVVGMDSLGKITIEINEHTEISLDKNEVLKFKIEASERSSINDPQSIAKKRKSGFVNVTQLGLLAGKSVYEQDFFAESSPFAFAGLSMESYNGYQFNPFLSSGLTAGMDVYQEGLLIPVGVAIRGTLLDKVITPTAFFTGGYSLPWPEKNENREFKGGYFLNTGLGILVKNSQNTALQST